MMIHQFKQGGGFGVCFANDGLGFEKIYGKVGEWSDLKPSNKPTPTTTTIATKKITPREPSM